MSEPLLKHSRLPRKQNKPVLAKKNYTVSKRPLNNFSQEERTQIAHTVLERYMAGEQVAAMAGEFGTSDVTIYALLLREHEEAWAEVQKARALARLERAQSDLEVAPDAISLARAREQVRSAQWELERLLRRLYGQEMQVNVAVVDLGDRLRRARERVSGATNALQHDDSNVIEHKQD